MKQRSNVARGQSRTARPIVRQSLTANNLYLKELSLLSRARNQGPRKREPILREAVKIKCKILRAECRAEKRSAA